jgi:hypothetical protein
MTASTIGVVPDHDGQELGHYATREAAEMAAETIARKPEAEQIVHLPLKERVQTFCEGWLAILQELVDLGFEIELTGFETAEVVLMLNDWKLGSDNSNAEDACPASLIGSGIEAE